MKKNLLTLILFFFILKTYAQNIVLNPDFEQFTICPVGNGELQKADNWLDVVYSSDYMNCIFQGWTTQAVVGPQSGLGYAGFATYGNANGAAESFGQFSELLLLQAIRIELIFMRSEAIPDFTAAFAPEFAFMVSPATRCLAVHKQTFALISFRVQCCSAAVILWWM